MINRGSSIPAMVVLGLSLLVLLSANVSVASRGNVVQRRNIVDDISINSLLHRGLKSEKKSEKKSCKSLKGSKKDGAEACEENPDDEIIIPEEGIVVEEDVVKVTAKSEKKSKKEKSVESDKNAKSAKSDKTAKSAKYEDDNSGEVVLGSKSAKKSKKFKAKSEKKLNKSSKKSKKEPFNPFDEGFVPKEVWNQTFTDAVGTGFLFYDPMSEYAWYAYNAGSTADSAVVSVSSASAVDETVEKTETLTVKETVSTTFGRICPIDTTKNGQVIESLCLEIKPPAEWTTATSTEIQSVETCYGSVTGAIFKLAVIVKDTSKFMQFYDELVGGRLLVYDITLVGKSATARVQESVIAEIAYEGWESLYGEPALNSRPTFSPDCKTVYATWKTGGTVTNESGGSDVIINMEPTATTTIATDIEFAKPSGKTPEIWRLGTNSHLVGLTPSKDGKTLFSAVNVPPGDSLRSGGIVALEASTGKITQEYAFENERGLPNNAYTNVVLDNSGNTYHVDSLLGLVKFEGDNLKNGPAWSAIGSDSKKRELAPAADRPRDPTTKGISVPTKRSPKPLIVAGEIFTAYKPALEATNYTTVYSCAGSGLEDEIDGVVALGTAEGTPVWLSSIDDDHETTVLVETTIEEETFLVSIDSCGGITGDIVWGPSSAAGSGVDGIYLARGTKIQSLESQNGTVCWTYDKLKEEAISKFSVVADDAVLVANGGSVVMLNTTKPAPLVPTTPPVNATVAPSAAPVATLKPVSTPAPVNTMPTLPTAPVPPPTSPPSSSASTASYSTAFLTGLSLLVALLR